MNIAIVGSRDFTDKDLFWSVLEKYKLSRCDCIVSGGARGADSLARWYAHTKAIKLKEFLPDWKRYGRGAGFIRNKQIIEAADIVIAFWDGKSKGTKNSIDLAIKQKKELNIIRFQLEGTLQVAINS